MANKPGVVVYLDLLPSLEEYTPEEVGMLFLAILRYGEFGELPSFEDRGLRVLWREIQAKIDRDNAKYMQKVLDGAYGAYKRECEKAGKTPANKQLWLLNQREKHA